MSSEKLSHSNAAVREIAIRDLISAGGGENRKILAEHFKREPELKLKYLIKEFLTKESGSPKKTDVHSAVKKEGVPGSRLMEALHSTNPAMIKKAFIFAAENRIITALPEMERVCQQQRDPFLKTCILRLQAVRGAAGIPAIVTYASEDNEEVAGTVVQVLDGMQNTAALAALCGALFSGSASLKKEAGAYLRNVEQEKMAYLLRKMESSGHEEYQRTAAKMKEFLNWNDDSDQEETEKDTALSVILKRLKEAREPKIIATALCAISSVDGEIELKKEIIIPFSRHEDGRVRANAIEALSYLMTAEEKSFFADFLTDQNNRVTANAIIAVCSSPDYQQKYRAAVLSALESLLKDHGEDGVFSALYCIGILEKEEFLPLLESVFNNSKGKTRERSMQVMETWSGSSKKVARVLNNLRSAEEEAFGRVNAVRDVDEINSPAALGSTFRVKRDIVGMAALGRFLTAGLIIALCSFFYGFAGINILSTPVAILLFVLMSVIFAALMHICAPCAICANIPYRLGLSVLLALLFVLLAWTGWGMGAQIPMNVFEAFMTSVRLGYWKSAQPGPIFLFFLYIAEFGFFTFLGFLMLSGWKKNNPGNKE